MKRWVIAVIVVAGLAVGVAWSGAETAVGKAAEAAAMYVEETVVGTILTAQRMYAEGGTAWYQGELRVDRAEAEDSTLKAGQVLNVRYQVEKTVPPPLMPEAGAEVGGKLRRLAEAGGDEWSAEALEVLGRGELVNPGEVATVDLGSPEAKVLVKMFAPLRPACHQKTAELLKDLAAREPERVRVQIFDMAGGRQARREMRRERLGCATVLVNNRLKFTLKGEDGAREVELSHKPNEAQSSYNSEDVIAVAEQEIRRLYPEGEEGAEEESAP